MYVVEKNPLGAPDKISVQQPIKKQTREPLKIVRFMPENITKIKTRSGRKPCFNVGKKGCV